ncbi:MAG: alkaline phosphatase [Candidatus Hydrogenedentota bacterium]
MFHRIILTCLLVVMAGMTHAAEPKSAILFIGDGMGVAQTTAARIYQKNARDGKLTLDTFKQVALVRTYSASTMVTDSAASGTAMASGHKTDTLMIGQTPDGTLLESVLVKAKRAGKSVGIVTTTSVTHATPATFYAHAANRYNEVPLALQLIEYGEVDVVLGGGKRFFMPKGSKDPESGSGAARKDDRDLIAEAKAKGYRYIARTSEMESVVADVEAGKDVGKILGLFSPGMMAYELDRPKDLWGEPSLEEMTRLAISILSKNPKGYFLLVEGGRIDHASHANLAKHAVNETLEFDRSIKAGLELTNDAEGTLIVVTADHETGGFAINGYPSIEIGGDAMFSEPAGIGGDHIVTFATGPGANRKPEENKAHDDSTYRQPSLVAASSSTHTGVDVACYSAGPGSEHFAGTLNNTDIGKNLIKLLGLE